MKEFKSNIKLFELRKLQTEMPKQKIQRSSEAAAFIRNFYLNDIEIFESFFMLTLNRANNTTGYAKISQGGISGTIVDVRLIAKFATDALASSVIVCHNHPSGQLFPSNSDKETTTKIKNALKFFDISLFDHIILTADDHFSFADEGLL